MALVRRPALAAALTVGLVGCAGSGSPQAREENQKMDALTRCGEKLEREAGKPVLLARSQGPGVEELPPVRLGNPTSPTAAPPLPAPPPSSDPTQAEGIRPPGDLVPAVAPAAAPLTPPPPTSPAVTPAAGTGPTLPAAPVSAATPPKMEGDAQVKIVASIGNNPIYDSEVREAVYQRLGHLFRVPGSQPAARGKEIYREELRKIIDRELVIDELTAALIKNKQQAALDKLRDAARKEAEQRLKEFRKDKGIPDDKTFREALRSQ